MPEQLGGYRRLPKTGTPQPHPLISVQQAALMLGCSAMTIHRRIEALQVPAVKIGRSAKVPRAFVEEGLDAAAAGQTVVVEEFAARWSARSEAQPEAVGGAA